MLGKFLQQETLQNGLNDYLNTYKYSNADTKELWSIFSRNTNQSLDIKVCIVLISSAKLKTPADPCMHAGVLIFFGCDVVL